MLLGLRLTKSAAPFYTSWNSITRARISFQDRIAVSLLRVPLLFKLSLELLVLSFQDLLEPVLSLLGIERVYPFRALLGLVQLTERVVSVLVYTLELLGINPFKTNCAFGLLRRSPCAMRFLLDYSCCTLSRPTRTVLSLLGIENRSNQA